MLSLIPCSKCGQIPKTVESYQELLLFKGRRYHAKCLLSLFIKNIGTEQAEVLLQRVCDEQPELLAAELAFKRRRTKPVGITKLFRHIKKG